MDKITEWTLGNLVLVEQDKYLFYMKAELIVTEEKLKENLLFGASAPVVAKLTRHMVL